MHTIRLHFALTVALVAILGTCFASAAGTSYYVSPSGARSTCTPSNPCALTTGLANAGFGDEVVLLNGVYTGVLSTKRDGVMIRAQNKHQAILRHPDGFDKGILIVQHDDITIRGLRINGERKNTPLLVGKEGGISNVLIEENILEDSGRSGMGIAGGQSAKNIVVRHNLIQSTGWRLYGEGIYVGTTHEDSIEGFVTVHIYGNTFRSFTLNGIDLKPNNLNTHIHHNIFEGQVPATAAYRPGSKLATRGNEGTISSKGTGNHIHDNIFRNLVDAGPGIFWASEDGGHRIVDNVIMGVDETNYAIAVAGQRFGGAATEITNNTFCNLPTYSIEKSSGIINIHHNPGIPGGAPQATCNAEISRILAEMKTLPGSSVRIPPSPPIGLRLKQAAQLWREAEAGESLTQPMVVGADAQASGGKYIWVPEGKGNLFEPAATGGEILYRFTVPIADTYAVWGRVLVNGGDSFFVEMDDNVPLLWSTQNGQGNWVWDQVHEGSTAPVRFTLTTETHTLRIKQREDGTKLDQILITNDLSYTPK